MLSISEEVRQLSSYDVTYVVRFLYGIQYAGEFLFHWRCMHDVLVMRARRKKRVRVAWKNASRAETVCWVLASKLRAREGDMFENHVFAAAVLANPFYNYTLTADVDEAEGKRHLKCARDGLHTVWKSLQIAKEKSVEPRGNGDGEMVGDNTLDRLMDYRCDDREKMAKQEATLVQLDMP
jgi:hypothetical protein